jgi:hypothetical protein
MKKLHSVDDVVKAMGGRKAVAELTGVTRKAVHVWVLQRSFPSKIYLVLKDALAKLGLEADVSIFSFSAPSNEGGEHETDTAA